MRYGYLAIELSTNWGTIGNHLNDGCYHRFYWLKAFFHCQIFVVHGLSIELSMVNSVVINVGLHMCIVLY